MQEVAAAVSIRRAHYLAGNGSFQLRPRHLERPKTFHFVLTDPPPRADDSFRTARGNKRKW